MISEIIGFIVILSILGMAFYCIKGFNMTIGFFAMSGIWVALAFLGNAVDPNVAMEGMTWVEVLTDVFQSGPEAYGQSVLVNVYFGAFFGVVLIETGIAATLIRKTVELGGDRPQITLILISITTTILFTSLTGVGPYIAIGVVVLPILLAFGISPLIAVFTFIASAGVSASFLNIVNFQQYQTLFTIANEDYAGYSFDQYFPFALIASILSLIIILVIACVSISRQKTSYSWAARKKQISNGPENAPTYSLIVVLMPVVLIVAFNIPIILAFIISSMYALITCGELKEGFVISCRKIVKYAADGAVSIAPMLGFLLSIATYNAAAAYISPYLASIITPIIPTTALLLCLMFGALGVFGHFRGPMNLVGSGIALLHVLIGIAEWPIVFLYPLFIVTTIVPQGLDITLSGAVWALDYSKVRSRDYMRMSIPTSWVLCILLSIVVYIMFGQIV